MNITKNETGSNNLENIKNGKIARTKVIFAWVSAIIMLAMMTIMFSSCATQTSGLDSTQSTASIGSFDVSETPNGNYETTEDMATGNGDTSMPGTTTSSSVSTPSAPTQTDDRTSSSGSTPNDRTQGVIPTETVKPTAKPPLPYALYVNRRQNVVTVYKPDANGDYTIPFKVMLCSTGTNNSTPVGTYNTTMYYKWRRLYGGYGQYAVRFYKDFLFHSVPYSSEGNKGTLSAAEYNKLGTQASMGCVRLSVADAKWIYDNCTAGTKVVVFESTEIGPFAKPAAPVIPLTSKWDPTDPDKNNPWNNIYPYSISGAKDITVNRGTTVDLKENISVLGKNGTVVETNIKVEGQVNFRKTGTYDVVYSITQVTGVITTKSVKIKVVDNTAPVVTGLAASYIVAEDNKGTMTYNKLTENATILDDGDVLNKSSITLTINGGSYEPSKLQVGVNIIKYKVTDESGNAMQGEISITVEPSPTESPTSPETVTG